MNTIWGVFTLGGYEFTSYIPAGPSDPLVWTIVVEKDGTEVRRETIAMIHEPLFGADIEDVRALDDRTDEIVREMGLEDG